jgi:GntR family transcriptional repressor for pyruvate dehydrogenase complex
VKIVSGELKLGDSLPSEGELLKKLGISRPTLREALRILEYEGLLQLGRGARAGATVLSFSIETAAKYGALYLASQSATLGEINEVRMLLEPPLVSVLARRAKSDLVRQLKEALKCQREALQADDYVAAVKAISDFHGCLVTSSQNRTLSLLVGMLREILPDAYGKLLLNGSAATKKALRLRTAKSSEAHAELIEIILRRQPSEAEAYWRAYMAATAAFLRKSKLYDTRVEHPVARY